MSDEEAVGSNGLAQDDVRTTRKSLSPSTLSKSPLPSIVDHDLSPTQDSRNSKDEPSAGPEMECGHESNHSENEFDDPIEFHRKIIGIPLDKIEIPREPRSEPDPELVKKFEILRQTKIEKNMNMNFQIQKRKDFRNPSIYEKLIDHCEINEFGSNFPPEVFDPAGFHEGSFFDQLTHAQKVLMSELSKQSSDQSGEKGPPSRPPSDGHGKTTTVEIVSGTAKRPASSSSSSSSSVHHSSSFASTSSSSKRNKRSKWDEGPSVRPSTSNKV